MEGFFKAQFKKNEDGPNRNKEAIVERENDLKMHKKAKKEKRIKR
jgi:hypothetical protein